ncbi:MAG TPA: CARDB domain-containing protein [Xanthobacteraceae bacterium]|nr:CARDB domain-containing protein [Xanthobacteraceae bacterium]
MAKTTKVIAKAGNVTKITSKDADISKAKASDVSKAKVVKEIKDVMKVVALPVTFSPPKGGLFIASWARVPVKIDPASGLKMDDLRFAVKEGPHAAQVSPCRDRLYDPAKPNIMLIAGPRAGKFTLEAFKKGAAKAVGSAQFTVTNIWTKADTGPSFSAMGMVKRPPGVLGATWGGGAPDTGPQNFDVHSATGDRNVAIILIDTSSERYPANSAGDIQTWENALLNGKADTVDGVTRSVRQLYEEVSYNNLHVTGTVFGPVQLPGAWDDYFEAEPTSVGDADPFEIYNPKAGYYEAAIAAAQDLVDFSQFHFVACVVKSFLSGTPQKYYWPRANLVQTTATKKDPAGSPVTYPVSCPVLSMPVDWEAVRPNRQVTDTLMHELGHTLGLGDLYSPGVTGRNMGAWDPMDSEDPDPHFSLPARLMLGWVQPDWIEPFNFQKLAPPVDQTVTLHAIELGTPPAGRKTGIEIRIADGKNYYFEYRAMQSGQVGDVNLPANQRVLGTDMISEGYPAPISRPQILLLPKHADDDGAVLDNGQKYVESDNTTPGFPAKLVVEVSNADATKADVRVRYGIIGTPDPAIRPWPASADNTWQSPDIEIRNERNKTDAAFFNTPWLEHDNIVVAKVTNQGSANAPQVTVDFSVKDYTVTTVPEESIGSDTRDVDAGATVEFTANWTPPKEGHFCTVARIRLYQNPTTLQVEASQLNNEAQSNYDYFIAASASPAERQIASVSVSNPYKKRTRVHLVMAQTHPFYRTYLATKMLTLNPGEVRKVEVMFESLIEIDATGPHLVSTGGKTQAAIMKPDTKLMSIPNNAMVVGIAEDPRTAPERSLQILGGAQARIATGRGTRFKEFKAGKESCSGRVVTADGKGVPGGKVIVTLKGAQGAKGESYVTTKVTSAGDFRDKLPARWKTAQAYYVPPTFFADCTSEVVKQ